MFKILQQPYPFGEKTNAQLIIQSIGEGAFIALFLMFFQPFGISEWQNPNKNWYLAGYGIITTMGGVLLRFGIFKIFPKYHSETSWNIAKEILSIMLLILLITIGNLLYSKVIFGLKQGLENFMWMFIAVLIIGVFPATFGVMINYIYQLKKYNQSIVIHHQDTENQLVINDKVLRLVAENEKDVLELSSKTLYYIESSDNYSTVFYDKNGKLQKELLRSSLTRLESQINDKSVLRCHRSYIVNLDKVQKITGNAQGYKLHLEVPELVVPVARKYSEVVEKLKSE